MHSFSALFRYLKVELIMFFFLSKSTDFEVHRNWMAVVYQKPIGDWYFEVRIPNVKH